MQENFQSYIKPKCCQKTSFEEINDIYGGETQPKFLNNPKGSIHIVQYLDKLVYYVKGTNGEWSVSFAQNLLPTLMNGSVLFSNNSVISQDNDNLFWDSINKSLGIGTKNPSVKLDVIGEIKGLEIKTTVISHGSSWSDGSSLSILNGPSTYVEFKPLGTVFSTNIGIGGATGSIQFPLRVQAAFTNQPGQMIARFDKSNGDDAMVIGSNGNVGIGGVGIFPTEKLHVAGSIRATTIPNYANTTVAAADTSLLSGSMFKVSNGDGTSSLHIKD